MDLTREEIRRNRKIMLSIAAIILLIIGVYMAVESRARGIRAEYDRLALENLENFIDLAFIVDLVSKPENQRSVDRNGLISCDEGKAGTYRVEEDIQRRAVFNEISFFESGVVLQNVRRFAGVHLGGTLSIDDLISQLAEEYGIEAEIYEHERIVGVGCDEDEGANMAAFMARLTGEACPVIIEIEFVKEGIPVVIIKTREYGTEGESTLREPTLQPVRTHPFQLKPLPANNPPIPNVRSTTTWTVIVGDRESD